MQIDLKALEAALAPIERIGQKEVTFKVGDTTITLRVLRPHEEIEATTYASEILRDEDNEDNNTRVVDYLDRLRIGFLSHAIVAIGDMDFRDVTLVETGEVLDSGIPIKITKVKALRELMTRWSRDTLNAVNSHFYQLTLDSEIETEAQVEFVPSNLDTEIERLTHRINDLKNRREREKADKARLVEQVAPVPKGGPPLKTEPPPEVAEPPPKVEAPQQRAPIIPQEATPPPPPLPPQVKPELGDSSFLDTEDERAHSALDAEHERILQRRLAAQKAPHLAAAEVEEEVGVIPAAAQFLGQKDGREVYALPSQELNSRETPKTTTNVPVNPPVREGGSVNPRFRPAKP